MGANLLVLDEPTNDLDLITLNVLERLILGFSGSVLLVTHDRYFLDKVATRILAVEGDGHVVSYPGNYTLYRKLKAQSELPLRVAAAGNPSAQEPSKFRTDARTAKLGYVEQRELEGMEAAIQTAEGRRASYEAALVDPAIYSDSGASTRARAEVEAATAEVDRLYARWEELLGRAGAG